MLRPAANVRAVSRSLQSFVGLQNPVRASQESRLSRSFSSLLARCYTRSQQVGRFFLAPLIRLLAAETCRRLDAFSQSLFAELPYITFLLVFLRRELKFDKGLFLVRLR